MGFEVPRRTAALVFEEYPGLEVSAVLDVPLQMFFDFQRMAESLDVAQVEKALREFGDAVLISWNAEIDGKAIPATGDGLMALSLGLAKDILAGWLRGIADVPAPLAGGSVNGRASLVEPAPMEASSVSQSN